MSHGTVQIVLVLDSFGTLLSAPRITPIGAVELESFEQNKDRAADRLSDAIEELSDMDILDDDRIEQAIRTALRQALGLPRTKRPIVELQIIRLAPDAIEPDLGKKKGAA